MFGNMLDIRDLDINDGDESEDEQNLDNTDDIDDLDNLGIANDFDSIDKRIGVVVVVVVDEHQDSIDERVGVVVVMDEYQDEFL